jgi:hypothetical protein
MGFTVGHLAFWIGADATGSNSQATAGTGISAKKLENETEDFTGAEC